MKRFMTGSGCVAQAQAYQTRRLGLRLAAAGLRGKLGGGCALSEPAGTGIPRTARTEEWDGWEPVDRATLVFVVRDGHVLLIRKKRGLGAGKINGPGGRIEPGESPRQCAEREVMEELRVHPTGLREAGILRFQFVDGYAIHVTVFRAEGCEGVARETDEAVPHWTPVDAIPYAEMWEDDREWLPLLLGGTQFEARFVFDDDALVDGAVAS
jgi:8-oxo-dGTP diphosphatase